MAWKKTPPEVVAAFEAARPKHPRAEPRKMFGFPAIFANGNLVAGTFEEQVMVRVPEGEAERLIAAKEARPFTPMAGRAMKGYVSVPVADARDAKKLAPWLDRALEATLTLPAKTAAKKAPTKIAARKTTPTRKAR